MPTRDKSVEKSFSIKSDFVDLEKRQIRFLASTGDIDRDGERILPEAFRLHLDAFLKNPVFLAGHQHRLSDGNPTVIGKVVKIWLNDDGLWTIIQFAESELGERYWRLYRDGFMSAVSVGFIPLKSRDIIENSRSIREHFEVELIEISAVAIPSNRQALARSKAAKLVFVDAKRREREDEVILKAIREDYKQQGRDWDVEVAEFSWLLLCGDFKVFPDEYDWRAEYKKTLRGETLENDVEKYAEFFHQ